MIRRVSALRIVPKTLAILLLAAAPECVPQQTNAASQPSRMTNTESTASLSADQRPPVRSYYGFRVRLLGSRYDGVHRSFQALQQTGVPLITMADGQWEPVSRGDDSGLYYLVPELSRITGWNVDKALAIFILGIPVISGLVGLFGLWSIYRGLIPRLLAIVPVGAGVYLACHSIGDVYVMQASTVLMLIPWLVYILQEKVRTTTRLSLLFAAGIVLGFAQWVRTQSGSPVLLFFFVLLLFSSSRRGQKVLAVGLLLLGMSLPLMYARIPLRERDHFLASHQTGYQPPLSQHLFWHTVYLGLAYLNNPYVPEWRDSAAGDYVQMVNPHVVLYGPEYESILKSRVKEIFHQDHLFVFYTVAAKLGVLASMLLLCMNMGLWATIRCPKTVGLELAFWISMSFAALPGIIAIPVPQYVFGMVTLALCYWYFSIAHLLSQRKSQATPKPMLVAAD